LDNSRPNAYHRCEMNTSAAPGAPEQRERKVARLSAEQLLCFQAACEDLRTVGISDRDASEVIDALFAAFLRGNERDWGIAVRAIARHVVRPSAPSSPAASQRLAQFVAENTDLLGA
jgi:hypothetical protein